MAYDEELGYDPEDPYDPANPDYEDEIDDEKIPQGTRGGDEEMDNSEQEPEEHFVEIPEENQEKKINLEGSYNVKKLTKRETDDIDARSLYSNVFSNAGRKKHKDIWSNSRIKRD